MHRLEIVAGILVLALVGCSDSETTPPATSTDSSPADTLVTDTLVADTAVVDSTPVDTADTSSADTTDAADSAVADLGPDAGSGCGNAPYQLFDPIAATILVDTPKTDVMITTNLCPSTSVAIPYKGATTMNVQRAIPFFFNATQTGNLSNFSGEYNIKSSAFAKLAYQAFMYPATFPLGVDSTWDATKKALLYVTVNASTGTGACSTKDGVTYTVPGHSEAVIKYKGGGTSTAGGGDANAWISLVTTGTAAAPEYVTITQTKTGCKVDMDASEKLFLTGRAPIAINTITAALGGNVTN